MKKIVLSFALAGILFSTAFARTNSYNLIENNSEFCSAVMVIADDGDSMNVILNPDLGSYFNLDSVEGPVMIGNINDDSLVLKSENTSHGVKTKTTTTATRVDGVISLVTEVKFGTFGAEKAHNELVLNFDGDRVEVNIKRTYREVLGSGWENESSCVYQIQ